MFVKERWEKIIASLHQNGSVRVKELAEQFQVSEDCIRKDLAALEKDGQLKRSYGGAVLEKRNVHKEDVSQRINVNTPQKRKNRKRSVETSSRRRYGVFGYLYIEYRSRKGNHTPA